MKEDNTTNTSPQKETQNKIDGKIGKPRIYSNHEECTGVHSERENSRNRGEMQFMRELWKEGKWY